MTRYIVREGKVHIAPKTEQELEIFGCYRNNYGSDWIVVEAANEAEALIQASAYDNRCHPAQVEIELFAVAYRAGKFS